MYAGDEIYEDDITSGAALTGADFIRDYYKDHSSCSTCGSPDPAIIEGRYCCDCRGEGHVLFLETRLQRLAREAGVA